MSESVSEICTTRDAHLKRLHLKMFFRKRVALNMFTKLTQKRKGGGSANADKLTKGGGGVGEMLTMAYKGGRGVCTPSFLTDIICEQPLSEMMSCFNSLFIWHFLKRTGKKSNVTT